MDQHSSDEQKMLDWLRKQHAGWRSTRMITAIGSMVMFLIGVIAGVRGEWLIGGPWIALGAGGLSYSIGSWAGRAEISMLLSLLEEREKSKDRT